MNSETKYLLPYKNFYKANLHSRSTLSDGKLPPERLKDIYKNEGYSVLALTDNSPVSEKKLSDEEFLVLSGFRFGASSNNTVPRKSSVFTAISLTEEPVAVPEFCEEYGSESIPSYVDKCKELGYFTTYCHPAKSCEVMPEQLKFANVDSLEIINYSSLMEGYDEYNAVCYDNFLRRNHRLFCTASDGNRNLKPLDSKTSDSFGAFTVINSDSLDYASVAKSLKEGAFYASEGPEIKALWIKGDTINIRTSPADQIIVSAGRRSCRTFYANGGASLTAAAFKINPNEVYVRFIVLDKERNRAYTRAYYIDELM